MIFYLCSYSDFFSLCILFNYRFPYCIQLYTWSTQQVIVVQHMKKKAVIWGETEKFGMLDHIWKEKGNYLPLWDKDESNDRAKHWRIRRLKETAHVLGYNDLLSWPSMEMNTIWEPIVKKVR